MALTLGDYYNSVVVTQAKGYRVGPVYDDVLSMAWVFLELIVKSMALEQSRTYSEALPPGLFSFYRLLAINDVTISLSYGIRSFRFFSLEFVGIITETRWLRNSIHDVSGACRPPNSALTEVDTSQTEDPLKIF